MAKAGIARILAVAAMATGAGAETAQAEAGPQAPLVIAVKNHAGVNPHVLVDGLAEARQRYRLAGVRTEWLVTKRPGTAELPTPDTAWITVVLLGVGMTSLGTKETVLGAAPPGPADAMRHVYIFADRIKKFAEMNDLPLARILGHVIAHEIGHVLLPDVGHGKAGLMQAVTKATAMHTGAMPSMFTAEENRAIRAFISRRQNAQSAKADFVEEAPYFSEAGAVTAQAAVASHRSAP